MLKKMTLKKWIILIFVLLFVGSAISGIIQGAIDVNKQKKKETDESSQTDKAENGKKEEPDKPKKEKTSDIAEPDFSEETLREVHDRYLEIADDYGRLIIKIEPGSDDYSEINIMVDESVYNSLDDNDKQGFIEEVGSLVEIYTRERIYKTPTKEFLHVAFVNSNFEHVAKTGIMDRGWKVK